MERKQFFHLFSDGFRTDALFEDMQAFVSGMNIVALCYLKCNVKILAFCLMDNHWHFILYGSLEECIRFRDKLVHKYSIWYTYRYNGRLAEVIDCELKLMENERYILSSIAYVMRNSIAAGFCLCSDDYPWSSGGLYFRDPEKLKTWSGSMQLISDMSTRERNRKMQTQMEIPADWRVTPEGYIWPGNYIDYKKVESLFRTAKSFTYFMGQGKEEEINRSLGLEKCVGLPDLELREKAILHCLRMFDTTNMRRLDASQRINLGKVLRKEYKCSAKQIARIIHLDPKYIKELV